MRVAILLHAVLLKAALADAAAHLCILAKMPSNAVHFIQLTRNCDASGLPSTLRIASQDLLISVHARRPTNSTKHFLTSQ